MATAPTPGVGKRREVARQAAEPKRIRIRLCDKELTFSPNLTIGERSAVRKATGGLSFETYWDGETSIGLDSLQIMWWLARRANGEATLSLDTAVDEWPANITADDIDVEEWTEDDDAVADDPEV